MTSCKQLSWCLSEAYNWNILRAFVASDCNASGECGKLFAVSTWKCSPFEVISSKFIFSITNFSINFSFSIWINFRRRQKHSLSWGETLFAIDEKELTRESEIITSRRFAFPAPLNSSHECCRQQTNADNGDNVLPKNWWDVVRNLFSLVTWDSSDSLQLRLWIEFHVVKRINSRTKNPSHADAKSCLQCTRRVRGTFDEANLGEVEQKSFWLDIKLIYKLMKFCTIRFTRKRRRDLIKISQVILKVS